MDWPNDADGDVMRRLQDSGFDFDREAMIDFNIDCDRWPPDSSVIGILENELASAKVSVQDDHILVQVRALLTYPFVIKMQANLTRIGAAFGGRCESWGVFLDSGAKSGT
jgi:Regulator of ribonuclease activity B